MKLALSFIIPLSVILLLDVYVFQSVKAAFQQSAPAKRNLMYTLFWAVTVITITSMLTYRLYGYKHLPKIVNSYLAVFIVSTLFAKLIVGIFLLFEDLTRSTKYVVARGYSDNAEFISRSQFLSRAAMLTAAVPFFALIYGVVVNAFNFQFKRIKMSFPNLPAEFDGFRIIQLSDIHSGGFTRSQPLVEVVAKINAMNADVILFTGDLVNNIAEEMTDYMHIFSQLKAKHGVLSITGNHDYGDYVPWDSKAAKKENFQRFIKVHADLGWKLLMNENEILERNGEKIAIIGIENWGHALNFPKYGKLDVAYKGTEEIPFKVLMSHDPSHWDAQVRTEYPAIDLTLSGHTHGFQFGIETKYFKWSPSQWVYKQWAGLYQEGKQYLYVNRGFGCLGYPGRLGILPEVTEIELKRG